MSRRPMLKPLRTYSWFETFSSRKVMFLCFAAKVVSCIRDWQIASMWTSVVYPLPFRFSLQQAGR